MVILVRRLLLLHTAHLPFCECLHLRLIQNEKQHIKTKIKVKRRATIRSEDFVNVEPTAVERFLFLFLGFNSCSSLPLNACMVAASEVVRYSFMYFDSNRTKPTEKKK